MNLSTSFRELPFSVEKFPLWLKLIYSVLCALTCRPVPEAARSRLRSRLSARAVYIYIYIYGLSECYCIWHCCRFLKGGYTSPIPFHNLSWLRTSNVERFNFKKWLHTWKGKKQTIPCTINYRHRLRWWYCKYTCPGRIPAYSGDGSWSHLSPCRCKQNRIRMHLSKSKRRYLHLKRWFPEICRQIHQVGKQRLIYRKLSINDLRKHDQLSIGYGSCGSQTNPMN